MAKVLMIVLWYNFNGTYAMTSQVVPQDQCWQAADNIERESHISIMCVKLESPSK